MDLLSPYLIAIGVAWITAHIVKYTIATIQGKHLDLAHHLFISGGMPSSHAATTVSVWTVVLLKDGYESGLFGLATLITLIVCYDAVKVRRSVGEQGYAIQELIKQTKSPINLPRAAKGHTPIEVFMGSLLGLLIGLVVYIATK